ncbi:MAG: hypothetical protein AAF598_17090, partial [Bacteroidota bacterium]
MKFTITFCCLLLSIFCLAQDEVVSFTLIDASTNTDIGTLNNNDIIDLANLSSTELNVRANTNPTTVGSVVFGYDGNANSQTESAPPYALAGDAGGNYNAWTPTIGTHTLTATPYSGSGGNGTAGTSLTIQFVVVNGPGGGGTCTNDNPAALGVSGELKKWHKVTITFQGPNTSE